MTISTNPNNKMPKLFPLRSILLFNKDMFCIVILYYPVCIVCKIVCIFGEPLVQRLVRYLGNLIEINTFI